MIVGHESDDFTNEYVELVKRAERFESYAYFNPGDVPTIGYGFAFITTNPGHTVFTARSLASINAAFAGIHTFDNNDFATLQSIATDLNNSHYSAANTTFNAWSFSSVSMTEPEASTVLGRVASANAQEIPGDILSGLSGTRELAVLYSLAYNGPDLVGTNTHLAWAIRHDDRAEAWYEIRYGSNGGDAAFQHGLAKRHYAESQSLGWRTTMVSRRRPRHGRCFGCSPIMNNTFWIMMGTSGRKSAMRIRTTS